MIKDKLKAASIHLIFCVVFAGLAGLIVFKVWYPYPYLYLSGGMYLFFVLIFVDIVCGPFLTAVVFNKNKSVKELVVDISVITLIQFVIFFYGVYSVYLARPVALVFEVDRFVAVSFAQVSNSDYLKEKISEIGGINIYGIRKPFNADESFKAMDLSLQGLQPSSMPNWWQDYEESRLQVINKMKNAQNLILVANSKEKVALNKLAAEKNLNINDIYYLPLVSEKNLDQWSIILNKNADVIGYQKINGFQ